MLLLDDANSERLQAKTQNPWQFIKFRYSTNLARRKVFFLKHQETILELGDHIA